MIQVIAEDAPDEARPGLWQRLVAVYPSYAAYVERTDRRFPILLLRPRDPATDHAVA